MWLYVTKSCPIEHEWKCVKFPWTLSLSPLRAYFRYEDNILNDYTMRVVQALSHVGLFVTPWTAARQTSLSFTISWSLVKSCLLGQWCHPAMSSSVIPFSSCLHSFPASGSFLMSQLFASGGQRYWSFSISPSNEYSGLIPFTIDWFDLGVVQGTLKRVFSNTTVQKQQFFSTQPSLWSNSPICTWLLENPWLWLDGPLLAK